MQGYQESFGEVSIKFEKKYILNVFFHKLKLFYE